MSCFSSFHLLMSIFKELGGNLSTLAQTISRLETNRLCDIRHKQLVLETLKVI